MTIQSQTTRVDYTGNGATTNFPVSFYWLQDTDLLVIRTDNGFTPPKVATLALGTDYVVTGSGNQSGGSITTTVAPTTTQKLSILRNVPLTQLTHYVPNDPFPAASHEQALDKLTMEVQQVQETLNRAVVAPTNDSPSLGPLPPIATRANAALGFDANGNPTAIALTIGSVTSPVVPTITMLRAASKTTTTAVFVTGYYAAGDGGGGAYWYDPTDTTSADNGGTIIVASDGGRWKLQLTAPLSAKQFGAKIDGSTDDTAAINKALATGLDVYLPKGTTVISSGLTSSAAQQLFGDGRELSVIQVNGNGYDALTLSGSYSGVRDLSFTATAARTSNAYVKFSAATRGNFVQRVKTTNAFYGIWIATNAVITTIEDVEMASTAPTNGIGIFIAGGNDTFLTRVVMDAPAASQPMCGVRIKSSQATWMTDCDLIHQGRGLQIDPDNSAGDLITWCFFENVACDLGTSDGLIVNPQNGATVKGLFFNNCWFSSNLHGVNVLFGAGTGNVIDSIFFNSCTLFNNKNQGAILQSGNNIEFNICRVSGNSQSSSGVYAGLEFSNNVSNFSVRGTRSGAIAAFPATQSYGLLIGTGCDVYQITNNNFYGNVTGAAADNSAGASTSREVRGNLGYKTVASGAATINTGTNSVSVNHGLAGTPSVVLATPSNANLGGLAFWTGTFAATTFNINTSGNVTANTPFSWQASLYN